MHTCGGIDRVVLPVPVTANENQVAVGLVVLLHPAAKLVSSGLAGLMVLAYTARRGDGFAALPLALSAALATSVYSLSDKAATAHLPSFASLVGFVTVGYLASFIALTLQLRAEHGRWRPHATPRLAYLIVAGASIGTAYALVIHAMRYLPAAVVVAFTNAGIVIAGLLSIFLFQERTRWRMRLLGMGIICVGLSLFAIRPST